MLQGLPNSVTRLKKTFASAFITGRYKSDTNDKPFLKLKHKHNNP